ncbi:hypothetical protein CBS101457_006821 [Exobasidium rhododendri]|nr:hypothetical protein CBS101457_006821 [Exobasidium rhododendri]
MESTTEGCEGCGNDTTVSDEVDSEDEEDYSNEEDDDVLIDQEDIIEEEGRSSIDDVHDDDERSVQVNLVEELRQFFQDHGNSAEDEMGCEDHSNESVERFASRYGRADDILSGRTHELRPASSVEAAMRLLKLSPCSIAKLESTNGEDAIKVDPYVSFGLNKPRIPEKSKRPTDSLGLIRYAVHATKLYLQDANIPLGSDLLLALGQSIEEIYERFEKHLTKTGFFVLDWMLSGNFRFQDFVNEEDLLQSTPEGKGGCYLGFGFSKDYKLIFLYVGRSCNMLYRNAAHLACSLIPLSMPCLHYRLARQTLLDQGKVFYKQVSLSQEPSDQFFWETLWGTITGTFQLGVKGGHFLQCRQEAGLRGFGFLGANSIACFQSGNWAAISGKWTISEESDSAVGLQLVTIYSLKYQLNMNRAVLLVCPHVNKIMLKAKERIIELETQLAISKQAYYDRNRALLLEGALVVQFFPYTSNRSRSRTTWNASNFFGLSLPKKNADELDFTVGPSDSLPRHVTAKLAISDESSAFSDLFTCRSEKLHHLMKGVSIQLSYNKKSTYWQIKGNSCNAVAQDRLIKHLLPALGRLCKERF